VSGGGEERGERGWWRRGGGKIRHEGRSGQKLKGRRRGGETGWKGGRWEGEEGESEAEKLAQVQGMLD
jgi:hypothetical protein